MKKNDTRGLLTRLFGLNNNEIKIDIINNEHYMEWLIKFTEQFPAWRDDMINYQTFIISNEDKKNMVKLKYFFEIVNNYAYENGIRKYSYDNEVYYLVKINNYGLRIGMITGPEICYYCQREINNDMGCIDFGNIKFQSGHKNVQNDYRKELLQLETIMMELYQKKIPVGTIEDTTKNVLKKIKYKDGGNGNEC